MGGALARISRATSIRTLTYTDTSPVTTEGSPVTALPLQHVLALLSDLDVAVFQCCCKVSAEACRQELYRRFQEVEAAEAEWVGGNVTKSITVLHRSIAAWLAKLVVTGNPWLLPSNLEYTKRSRSRSGSNSSAREGEQLVASITVVAEDVNRAVTYFRSIKGKYATMPDLALSLVQGCNEEEARKVELHERLFAAQFEKFKCMYLDEEHLEELCRILQAELNSNKGEALRPLFAMGSDMSSAFVNMLNPLIDTYCEEQGITFTAAFTRQQLLACIKAPVGKLTQLCSKSAAQTKKRLREILASREFPPGVDSDSIALELAQKLKAAFLSRYITDDALYQSSKLWVAAYLARTKDALPPPLQHFPHNLTYSQILKIETAQEVSRHNAGIQVSSLSHGTYGDSKTTEDTKQPMAVENEEKKEPELSEEKTQRSGEEKKGEGGNPEEVDQIITAPDVGVSKTALVWLERQVADRLDPFIGPFTTDEVKKYAQRKALAAAAEEGAWVRLVIDSFRAKFVSSLSPPQRLFMNIFHYLLRYYIHYSIMRSHAVKHPTNDSSHLAAVTSALHHAICLDFGRIEELPLDTWEANIADAIPFIQAVFCHRSFLQSLVSMGMKRYRQWLNEKQESMELFAKSFAHAVDVES